AQRRQRRATRAEKTAQRGQRFAVDVLGCDEPQARAVEHEAAGTCARLELPVVGGPERLHQRGLLQERAELARGALPLDVADLLREAQRRSGAQARGEMGEDPRAQGATLADVERRAAL